jgi:putative transposase
MQPGSRSVIPFGAAARTEKIALQTRFFSILLDGEIFYTLREAQIIIESWRRHYNAIRPHASLGYKPPAPEVFVPAFAAWPTSLREAAPPVTLAERPTLN